MQNNTAFQDALARAKEVAQRLSASAPNAVANPSLKRSMNEEESPNKRPAVGSTTPAPDIPTSVLRAQQIAQKINSQLGVKTSDSSSLPLTTQTTFQEDYKIPDKFVGLIIGKGGEQIIRLQAESGCKVQICPIRPEPVPGGPNPPDRIANLCGSREAIERARRIMDDIIARGKMADTSSGGTNPYSIGGTNAKTIDVMLPSAKCGLVIGKGGETIRRLSEEFLVKMYVAQEVSEIDGIEHKPLRITGESDRVERVKQHILDTLAKPGPAGTRFGINASSSTSVNDYGSRAGGTATNGPCNEASYPVPYDKAGIIIGKGGESIKEINRKSGAFVELDKTHIPVASNSGERLFKIRGTPEQIVLAQQLMYEKVINSPHGAGDILTPTQFQQKFNLPLMGDSSSSDPWAVSADPYAAAANASDLHSQWAQMYGQWPQMHGYEDGTSKSGTDSSSANPTDMSAMGQMDPAWLAYYQSMNLYMMQSSMTGNTTSTGSSNKSSDSTASTTNTTSTATAATSSGTNQPDYSQQWIAYYRSLGQNDMADQIERQMKESAGSTASSTNPTSRSSESDWAAYAQQWASNAMASNGTNGNKSSTAPSS